MALLSEVQERSWAKDKYGDNVLRFTFDWRDTRIMSWINNFARISRENTMGNVERQGIGSYRDKRKSRKVSPYSLKRSLFWKTWATSGGDAQVFEARYIYYAKFVELAVGKGDKYDSPVPDIPGPRWKPITVPSRRRKGKPHVVTEMRTQASKFTSFARAQFSFAGTMYMLYSMGSKDNPAVADAVNRALFWSLRQERTAR